MGEIGLEGGLEGGLNKNLEVDTEHEGGQITQFTYERLFLHFIEFGVEFCNLDFIG